MSNMHNNANIDNVRTISETINAIDQYDPPVYDETMHSKKEYNGFF